MPGCPYFLGLFAAIFFAAQPAWSRDVPDQPGPWAIGHTERTATDSARGDRVLEFDIWYPAQIADPTGPRAFYSLLGALGITSARGYEDPPVADPGAAPFPLIVFSHGYGSINTQSFHLMEHLASHGFFVIAPEHTGNTQADLSSPAPEFDRYPDVAFVIDEAGRYSADVGDPFHGRIDTLNAGVAGHSYGGMTAQFMAAGHPPFGPDPRVKAIMPIAGSSSQLTDAELASISVPQLLLVGTLDGLRGDTIRSFSLGGGAPYLYRVDVLGGNHTHFANVCDIGNFLIGIGLGIGTWPSIGAGQLVQIYWDTCVPPAFPVEEATRIQNLFATAHFRRHLNGERYYDSYLAEAYARAREPDIDFVGGVPVAEDSFLCYRTHRTMHTTAFRPQTSEVVDAFEEGTFAIRKTRELCVPADVDGSGLVDDRTYLKSYRIKGPRHVRRSGLAVEDRFGTWQIDTSRLDRLLVPAAKELGNEAPPVGDSRDHFKCYRAKPTRGASELPKGVRSFVAEHFESRIYEMRRLLHLCLPADVDGLGVIRSDDALTCYRVRRASGEVRHSSMRGVIHTRDVYGPERLDTVREHELCVPASLMP